MFSLVRYEFMRKGKSLVLSPVTCQWSRVTFLTAHVKICRSLSLLTYSNNSSCFTVSKYTYQTQFSKMSGEVDKSMYILPLDQPVSRLEIETAFDGLIPREKIYAHNISKASWVGGLVTLLQTSPESGPIYVLLHKLFSAQSPADFREAASKADFTSEEITALYVYTAGVFSNSGNYKGFGDSKFIPGIEQERLQELLKVSDIWSQLEPLWTEVKDVIYDLRPGKTCLGFPPQGCTTYLTKNCTPQDDKIVQNWLKNQKMECYNTRLFKTENNKKVTYEIRLASEEEGEIKRETEGNTTFRITKGDYSPLMGLIVRYLEEAEPHAANAIQAYMLRSYMNSFLTGSLDDHKQGSRYWIQDKSPAVESYIGFIETYRDPAGVRGEFEGFVAVVNRSMSEKFNVLVNKAEELLPLLPWNKGFEKDRFLKPDFTSLDVLTFGGSGIPAGINIPNYDEIRQSEGFKNVSLGNVIPASYATTHIPFLSDEDAELLQKWRVTSFELQVGLHELLGHGSGKLLRREQDGTLNYPDNLVDPLTGELVSCWYEPGDTYDSRFGPLGSPYEECRAEAVGLYLSLEASVLKIFGHEDEQAEEVMYVNWLSLVWAGAARALEMWEPGRGWLQAHSQARFAIARVLIQAGVVSVTEPNPGELLISLDRQALGGAGRCAIGQFLLQLQVYKATGNVEAAQKLFSHYSDVVEPWLSWRSIVLANKQPRKMLVQANTVLVGEEVELKTYEGSVDGMILSSVERFEQPEVVYEALLQLSRAEKDAFM